MEPNKESIAEVVGQPKLFHQRMRVVINICQEDNRSGHNHKKEVFLKLLLASRHYIFLEADAFCVCW